jgi:hypothetical protein
MNKTKESFPVDLVKSVLSSEEIDGLLLSSSIYDKTINKMRLAFVLKKQRSKDLLNNLFQNKTIARWQRR